MLLRVALGHVSREYRKQKNLSMREVSLRSGISIGHISGFERGKKEMSSELLEQLCKGIEVPTNKVLEEAVQYV